MAAGDPASRIVIDAYSPLSHKALVGDPHRPIQGLWTAPSWVPANEKRRIAAYIVRAAYRANVARLLLSPQAMFDVNDVGRAVNVTAADTPSDHREYGDADLIIDRVVAGVLGNEWSLVVNGADDDIPDAPELPEEPEPPAADASDVAKRIYAIQQAQYEADATAIVDSWEAALASRPLLQARQDKLRAWADKAMLPARLDEAEHDAAGLGDSVIVAWPRTGDWPRIECYDPGFYFPVLDDDLDEDYPTKVHLAWEIDDEGNTETARPTHVRRLTFELVDLTGLHTNPDGTTWIGPDGEHADQPALAVNEQVDDTGRVYRLLPWDLDADGNPQVLDGPLDEAGNPTRIERRSYRTCLVTDARWPLGGAGAGLANLAPEAAVYAVQADGTVLNRLDLGCDFLPVVHVPNTPSGKEHYGRAVLDVAAQLLDDLAQSDTDVMTSARFCAGPVIGLSNAKMDGVQVVQPGIVYNLGENGSMNVLDLSAGLTVLQSLNKDLQQRLTEVARVPAEMIGRVSSNKAVSGVAMALAFAPFAQLVGVMRMARAPKYQLLLRIVQRLAQLQRVLPPGPTLEARIQFGNFLPSDKDAAVTMVAAALTAKAISHQTAVAMLVAAGLPIDDAQAEVERIQQEDTAAAVAVFDATGSAELAADRLGLDLPTPAGPGPAPVIKLPPPGGGVPPS